MIKNNLSLRLSLIKTGGVTVERKFVFPWEITAHLSGLSDSDPVNLCLSYLVPLCKLQVTDSYADSLFSGRDLTDFLSQYGKISSFCNY